MSSGLLRAEVRYALPEVSFGSIFIDGTNHDHGVVIGRDKVRKR
jgi:hypothetical protein